MCQGSHRVCAGLRQSTLLLVLVLLSAAVQSVHAQAIPGLHSTGVDDKGNLLPPGSVDPHYTLQTNVGSYGPLAYVASTTPDAWNTMPGDSLWLAPTPDASADIAAPENNIFIYRTTFDLGSSDPNAAVIRVLALADDGGEIYLNGNPTGIPTLPLSSNMLGSGYIIDSGFVAGVNVLEFRIQNAPETEKSPTGLRVSISGTVDEGLGFRYEPATGAGLATTAELNYIYDGSVTVTTADPSILMLSHSCTKPDLRDSLTLTASAPDFCIHGVAEGQAGVYFVHDDGRDLQASITVEPLEFAQIAPETFIPDQPWAFITARFSHASHDTAHPHYISLALAGRKGLDVEVWTSDAIVAQLSTVFQSGDYVVKTAAPGDTANVHVGVLPGATGSTDVFFSAIANGTQLFEASRIHVQQTDLPFSDIFRLLEEADIRTGSFRLTAERMLADALASCFGNDYELAVGRLETFMQYISDRTQVKRGFPQYETDLIRVHVQHIISTLTQPAE